LEAQAVGRLAADWVICSIGVSAMPSDLIKLPIPRSLNSAAASVLPLGFRRQAQAGLATELVASAPRSQSREFGAGIVFAFGSKRWVSYSPEVVIDWLF
jgi:hypothetical protein